MPGRFTGIYLQSLKEMRPTLYREMEQASKLESSAEEASENAKDMVAELISTGTNPVEAQNQAIRQYLLWPDEKEVPDLLQNPYSMD